MFKKQMTTKLQSIEWRVTKLFYITAQINIITNNLSRKRQNVLQMIQNVKKKENYIYKVVREATKSQESIEQHNMETENISGLLKDIVGEAARKGQKLTYFNCNTSIKVQNIRPKYITR